MLLIPI
jgi:feruloyl esterase